MRLGSDDIVCVCVIVIVIVSVIVSVSVSVVVGRRRPYTRAFRQYGASKGRGRPRSHHTRFSPAFYHKSRVRFISPPPMSGPRKLRKLRI